MALVLPSKKVTPQADADQGPYAEVPFQHEAVELMNAEGETDQPAAEEKSSFKAR